MSNSSRMELLHYFQKLYIPLGFSAIKNCYGVKGEFHLKRISMRHLFRVLERLNTQLGFVKITTNEAALQ